MKNGDITQVFAVDRKYIGSYVAMPSFEDPRVIAFSKDAQTAIQTAKQQGFDSPVVFFVPDNQTCHYYTAGF